MHSNEIQPSFLVLFNNFFVVKSRIICIERDLTTITLFSLVGRCPEWTRCAGPFCALWKRAEREQLRAGDLQQRWAGDPERLHGCRVDRPGEDPKRAGL